MCMVEEISLVVLGLLVLIDLSLALSLDCVNEVLVLATLILVAMCLAKSIVFPILCLLLRESTNSVGTSYMCIDTLNRGIVLYCIVLYCIVLYCIVLYLLRLPLQHKAGVNGGPNKIQ